MELASCADDVNIRYRAIPAVRETNEELVSYFNVTPIAKVDLSVNVNKAKMLNKTRKT